MLSKYPLKTVPVQCGPGFRWLFKKLLNVAFFVAIFLISTSVTGQNPSNIQGIVPIQSPVGGMAIDGDIWANAPAPGPYATVGDWFPNPVTGLGGSVYTNTTSGWTVIDPAWSFKVVDD